MKWYSYLISVIVAVISFMAGWVSYWFTHSLDCPLCLCQNRSVDQSYMDFWLQLFDRYALPAGIGIIVFVCITLVILIVIAHNLGKIAKKD